MDGKLRTRESDQLASWWQPLPAASASGVTGATLRCELCPHACTLRPGERGACQVRRNIDGQLRLTTYGRATRIRLATVEQTSLYHFHPGAATLSLATVGCNLHCVYCANGDAAPAHGNDARAGIATADGIARAARAYGAQLLSLGDDDPVACAEYAIDTAIACRAHGLKTVAATAGYIRPAPARDLYAAFDAVNVGVKAFSDAAYARICGGHLSAVLDTLVLLRFETRCWLEISYVLIAGLNDTAGEIDALAGWIAHELGPEVPLHFSSLACGLRVNVPSPDAARSRSLLALARQRAIGAGLHHVYTKLPSDSEGATTFCPSCQAALIERHAQTAADLDLTEDGRCPYCHTPIAGYFDPLQRPRRNPRHVVQLLRR